MDHIADHDLERFHLGTVVNEAGIAPLEEHLLACPNCVERAEESADYLDALRASPEERMQLAGSTDCGSVYT